MDFFALLLTEDVQKAFFIGILREKGFRTEEVFFLRHRTWLNNLLHKLCRTDPKLLDLAVILIFVDVYSEEKQLVNLVFVAVVVSCVTVSKI